MAAQVESSLVAAGNTYNPSLLVLHQKGYDLCVEGGEQGTLFWSATKGLQSFLGYSPPELLGIVVLWEHFGENWNQQRPNVLVGKNGLASRPSVSACDLLIG